MELIEEVKIEYNRLNRHVEDQGHEWSEHVMRDLAACLRNWVQLAKNIDSLGWQLVFPYNTKTKTRKRIEQQGSESDDFLGELKHKGIFISKSVVHNRIIGPEEIRNLWKSEKFNQEREEVRSFSNWFGDEAHQLKLMVNGKPVRKGVARSMFIDRCANILGGTHPINYDDTADKGRDFKDVDRHIIDLMNRQVNEIPLPYAHLLNYAQTILKTFRPFLFPDPSRTDIE